MSRIIFKGLGELRAIAALSVIFHHVELYKNRNGMWSLYDSPLEPFISHLGHNGVHLFFVLSGFLITYLLLAEKENKGHIDIPKFYLRRVLRIWPVYYLVMILAFFALPLLASQTDFLRNEYYYIRLIELLRQNPVMPFLLFLFFLPNVARLMSPTVVGASQS